MGNGKEAARRRQGLQVINGVPHYLGTPLSKLVEIMEWLLGTYETPSHQSKNSAACR